MHDDEGMNDSFSGGQKRAGTIFDLSTATKCDQFYKYYLNKILYCHSLFLSLFIEAKIK